MKLLVDIGNTRLKWQIKGAGRCPLQASVDRKGHALEDILTREWAHLPLPSRILAANVAGQIIADQLSAWTAQRWGILPELATVQEQAFGVRNGYHDHRQLGIDRWLALIAAWDRCKTPACVVDCGTAVTIDALSADGEHLGGLITPGMGLMQRSLTTHTHGIQVEGAGRPALLARNTRDGIAAGAAYAIAGCVESVASKLCERFGGVRCFITGGDAGTILPLLVRPFEPIPDLVLQGLALIAEGSA